MSEKQNNDFVRETILRILYRHHKNSRGIKNISVGIRELQSLLKEYNFKGAEINSNLDYLVQKGWVREVKITSQFNTNSGFQKTNEKITYKISDIGIDKLEGASLYSEIESTSRINITNIKGVTIIGDGNVVNTEMVELSSLLHNFKDLVYSSDNLDQTQKLSVSADIDSIQSQLTKPKPMIDIVKNLWSGIETIVTASEFMDLLNKVGVMIRGLSN